MREFEMIFHDDVSARAQGIYTYLRYRQGKNEGCFPTHKTIARENKCSVSTVKRAIKELKEKGYKTISGKISTRYFFERTKINL